MGEVYLARDTELGRLVALKFLPADVSSNRQRMQRFTNEAKIVSSLNHPNILTIFEVGEIDGTRFIATEYVDGITLRQHINDNPPELKSICDIALQICNALEAAHSAGIVHRDIKPENIMLRKDGIVKVLDFGLAKLSQENSSLFPEAETLAFTEPGLVFGTISYMSPEQARGQKIDQRTDIFSLGVVLYEMIAVRIPFEGATASDILVSVLDREPAPLRQVPPEVEALVLRALAKDKESRYQTAGEMSSELRHLKKLIEFDPDWSKTTLAERYSQASHSNKLSRHTPATSGAIDSLAILPLTNVSADPSMEYLSDGITESIINSLSQLPQIRVMARATVFRYKNKDIDPQDVGRELGVRAVMHGKVLQMADMLVIRTELVNIADGSQIWGEQYKRRLSDILELQEEISKTISERLRVKLTGEEEQLLTRRYTENIEAYQLYLKGRYFWSKRTREGLRKGVEYFKQAIDGDPTYALAYAGLADAYAFLGLHRVTPPHDILPKARAAAVKALQIDSTLAEAHSALANIKTIYDWDWAGAENDFKRSLQLNQKDATTHSYYANYLAAMGRHEEAMAETYRAQELDPLSPIINVMVGYTAFLKRDYVLAIEQCRKTLEIEPSFFWIRMGFGWAYEEMGMFERAIPEFEKAVELTGGTMGTLAGLGHAYGLAGCKQEALEIIRKLQDKSQQSYVVAYDIALVFAGLQDTDQTLAWLEVACTDRFGWLIWINVEPKWDFLRTETRFQSLLQRIGF